MKKQRKNKSYRNNYLGFDHNSSKPGNVNQVFVGKVATVIQAALTIHEGLFGTPLSTENWQKLSKQAYDNISQDLEAGFKGAVIKTEDLQFVICLNWFRKGASRKAALNSIAYLPLSRRAVCASNFAMSKGHTATLASLIGGAA